LQPAEASIRSLRVSLVSQPSLILQLRNKSIPVGGPLSGGYSSPSLPLGKVACVMLFVFPFVRAARKIALEHEFPFFECCGTQKSPQ
ncbi:hypothetical protein, partial [uncultured Shimia sp.]|uniref:hypothetical protein n=1 Tax=uncultured Shimia sp. TaxID=573152 RepID=UPI0026394D17